MQITYETFDDQHEYQSLLVINADDAWKETLYFTFFTPWGEEEEKLYAGRYMADVHFKDKPCRCVYVFDFHRWTAETLQTAMQLELPPTMFETGLTELIEQAMDERDKAGGAFTTKVKIKKAS